MLAPNAVETGEDIAAAFSQFLIVNSFGRSAEQIVVSPLSPDPDWLPPLRKRVSVLANICVVWRESYPDIVSSYFVPFTNYASTFSAFAEQSTKFGNDVQTWREALDALHRSILPAQTAVRNAQTAFTDHLKSIEAVEAQLNTSLDTAWSELADEEQIMVALAEQITRLHDRVDQLQENLTSAEISSGKTYFQTAATITYTVLTAAEIEIPYLAIVTEVYTIGKMAYDLIVTDKEIEEALQQIADLTVKASEAAQAAAMSKAVIQLINSMNLRVAGLHDKLPELNRMWEDEAEKISAAKDAIASGAKPSEVFDLVSMPSAAASWNTLAELSRKAILTTPRQGKPVFLTNNTTKPTFSPTPV